MGEQRHRLRYIAVLGGYTPHNASHFNPEYKSLFGLPPMRDMERLRGTTRERIDLASDSKVIKR